MISNRQTIFIPRKIWTLIDQGANSGGNLLITIITARLLSPEDFGFYSVGLLLGMLSMEACQALIAAPAQTIGPKLARSHINGYCRSTIPLAGFLTGATSIAIFSGTLLYGFMNSVEAPFQKALLYLFASAGMQLHLFARRMAYVCENAGAAAIGSTSRYLTNLFASFIIGYTGFQNTPEQHLMALGLSGLAAAVLTVRLWWPGREGDAFSFSLALKKHWDFGKWLFGSAAINWFGSNWFIALAGAALGTASLGALRAAQNITGIIGILAQIMENTIPVNAARIQANHGATASFQYVMRIGTITVGVGSVISFFLILFSSDIMALIYSETYRQFGSILSLIAITYILSLVVFLIKVLFRTAEIMRPIFIAQVIIAGMTLLCAGPMISHFGIIGAAMGLLLVQLVSALILGVFSCFLIFRLNH